MAIIKYKKSKTKKRKLKTAKSTLVESMPIEQRFMILSSPRYGSTWFNSLLDSHPDIQNFGHIFGRPHGLKKYYLPFLYRGGNEEIFKELYRQRPQGKVHGYSLHGQNVQFAVAKQLLERVKKVIILRRINLTEMAVSNKHCRKTHVWEIDNDLSEEQKDKMRERLLSQIHLDIEEMRGYMRQQSNLLSSRAQCAEELGLSCLYITYEELCQDLAGVSKRVTEFLGVPYQLLSSPMQKLHNKGYGFITNIDEVNEKLGPEFGFLSKDNE